MQLVTMTEDEYAKFFEKSLQDYAKEKAKAGNWTPAEALARSEKDFHNLIPDGLATANHHFMMLVDDAIQEKVGWLWVRVDPGSKPKSCFIFEFYVYERFQGHGYGKAALEAWEARARQLGIKKINLHVFAHNVRAHNLYLKMGFHDTNINMTKELTD